MNGFAFTIGDGGRNSTQASPDNGMRQEHGNRFF